MPASGRSEGRSRGATTCCWRRRRRSSSGSRSSSAAAAWRPPRRCATSTAPSATSCSTGSTRSSRRASCASAQDSDGEPRFWMLETIREFGLELLESAGELEAACERHAAWTARRGRAARRRVADRRPPGLPRAGGRRVPERARGDRVRAQGARRRAAAAAGDGALGLLVVPRLRRRGQARARGGARAQRPPAGADAARPLHAAHAQREQRAAERGRRGGARGLRGAGRRLQPRAGLEPRRPRRGNRDGLAGNRRGRLEAGALVRAPRQLPGRAGREHLLADGERGLRAAARRGGHRPLPRVPRARGRRPDDPRDVLGRAGRARGDARRHRVGAGAPGRRAEDDRGSPASRSGPRSTRRRPISSSSSRARRGRRPRPCARATTTLDEGGERAYLSTIAGFLAHALLRRGQGRRGGALQPRERAGRRVPTTCSHRCSGGRRGRRSWRGAASSSRPRRSRARRSDSASRRDLLGTRADALCRSRRGARARRPPRGVAGRARATPRSCTSGRET